MWSGKRIIVGVTGGIAAYKAAALVSELRQRGAEVEVVMTPAAAEFVAPLTFRELSGQPVASDTFAVPARQAVQHIALAERADAIMVVPATANTLAKMAQGLADNLLTSVLLATRKPILVAPAMNTGMWENPATQANLAILRARGVHVVGPAAGHLLCGTAGLGRLAPQEEILAALERILTVPDFAGERVIVTAGGTREAVDPVRFLGNRSSGRMGIALARILARRGAEVILIAGALELPPPPGIAVRRVESTLQMHEAVISELPQATIVIMAGAPADFRPAEAQSRKIKRERAGGLQLTLVPTQDIAAAVGAAKKPDQLLVAFAAETEDLLGNAQKKLAKKRADLVVANDITAEGSGFGTETNQVTLLSAEDCRSLPLMTKEEVAGAIADALRALRAGRDLNA